MTQISWDMLRTTQISRAPRIVIHGQPKVGKSSFAAQMPKPLFLCTEEGLGRSEELRNVASFEINSYDAMMQVLTLLAHDTRNYQTLVIDSEDHLEPMLHKVVAAAEGKASLEDIPYGKGYVLAAEWYRAQYNEAIRYLNRVKGMQICHIAHSQATKVNPPDMPQGYTRWDLKLDKRIADLLREEADAIFYAMIPVITKEAENGFNGKTVKAVAVADRRIYCNNGGGYLAGTRWKMPEWLPLDWNQVKPYLTGVPGEPEVPAQAA